jgi:hypothetical protein
MLEIRKSNLVLRGAGPAQSILEFPLNLTEIAPDWGETTTGNRTSNYSWSGGFLRLTGSFQSVVLAGVTEDAMRGRQSLRLSSTAGLQVGQRIEIYQRDREDNSLAFHLYSNDPGDISKLNGTTACSLVTTITGLNGDRIEFDRPLRFDIRKQWNPVIRQFHPTVQHSGIEDLCLEFPPGPYPGHFRELGYNGIALSGVSDCWIRNVVIRNSDSGLFANSKFCTFRGLIFESDRESDRTEGCTGHHGIYISDDDNLMEQFDYRCSFIHDITVSKCAGNVIADGKGVDLCFDHHRRAPYENLFTNVDIGKGTRLWKSGGGLSLGRHSAGRETFWNLQSEQPQRYPEQFGPPSMNLVGYPTMEAALTEPDGKWMEPVQPGSNRLLMPPNLYRAQLERRHSLERKTWRSVDIAIGKRLDRD